MKTEKEHSIPKLYFKEDWLIHFNFKDNDNIIDLVIWKDEPIMKACVSVILKERENQSNEITDSCYWIVSYNRGEIVKEFTQFKFDEVHLCIEGFFELKHDAVKIY